MHMGKVIRSNRWTKTAIYTPKKAGVRWFSMVLVTMPLAAFTAISFAPSLGKGIVVEAAVPVTQPIDRHEAYFPLCTGRERVTCIVDGDTIWYRGEKIRLIGFDTPEISKSGCANERQLGERAKLRLQELLNAGAFSLASNPDSRSEDRYGRSLFVVTRDGKNVGEVLLNEGLAERRSGRGNMWCR